MKKLLLNTILLLSALLAAAQPCKYYSSDYDLSSSLVTCIFQDSEGTMWIGTENGLNRYDGKEFTVYQHVSGDRNSLAHNYVNVVFEDSAGHLLVGTYGGVQEFIREKGLFSWTPRDKDHLHYNKRVNDIIERRDGSLLISGEELHGISFISEEYMTPDTAPLGLPATDTSYLLEDSGSNLWILRDFDGVYRQSADGKIDYYSISGQLTGICEAGDAGIFVSNGYNGLYRYDPRQNNFVKCEVKGLEGKYINSISLSANGKIYVCTSEAGLLTWRPGAPSAWTFIPGDLPFDSSKIRSSTAFEDKDGNVWQGIYRKGLVMTPKKPHNFLYIGSRAAGQNFIGSSAVTSLMNDSKGVLWVGTDTDGIYSINFRTGERRHYARTNKEGEISSTIFNLVEDSKGRIWFGTYNSGLVLLDRSTGKCSYTERDKYVLAIAEEEDGSLLAGTMNNGVFRYRPDSGSIEYLDKLNERVGNRIECILKAEDGALYIGAYDGAFGIKYSGNPDSPVKAEQYLSKQIVYCIFKTGESIFFGTADGLAVLNGESGILKKYTRADGLPDNTVYGIAGNFSDGIWIGTSNGLSRFDPETEEFDNFYVGDGLQGNEFVRNAVCMSRDSVCYFGGSNGISFFKPSAIDTDENEWTIRHTVTELGRSSRLLELSTAEYNAPQGIRFEYKINGDPWTLLYSGERRVVLNSLSPGKYNVSVRTVIKGKRSDSAEFSFRIKPPVMLSVWAIIFYILVLTALVRLLINYYKLRVQAHGQLEQIKNLVGISHEAQMPVNKALAEVKDPELMSPDDRLMHRVVKIINENIGNPELTVDFIAQEAGVSRMQLYRKLKELTNQTSAEFVRNIRLAKAAEMLRQKKHSIAELSEAVGYNSPSAFSTAFKEVYGVSPTEYSKTKGN